MLPADCRSCEIDAPKNYPARRPGLRNFPSDGLRISECRLADRLSEQILPCGFGESQCNMALRMNSAYSGLTQLEERLGLPLVNISAGRERSREKREELTEKLRGIPSEDISVVVSGSLGRGEFTSDSDIDWTLLVDGPAASEHLDVAFEVGRIIDLAAGKAIGREGTFGSLTFSHNLVQSIGGEEDTNRNTTQRILLLLESQVVERSEAYERVVTNVLKRYLLEDLGFIGQKGPHHIPRFLLNDFARYWWTMAVDFAYKQRKRSRKGGAIRNIKLRMSRKIIYVSGLLTCFGCARDLDEFGPIARSIQSDDPLEYVEPFRMRLRPPLEVLAGTLLKFPHLVDTARKLFRSYDAFLGVLSDKTSRDRLENLETGEYESDELFQRARAVSHEFRDGLIALFFDETSGLGELTKMYGVF